MWEPLCSIGPLWTFSVWFCFVSLLIFPCNLVQIISAILIHIYCTYLIITITVNTRHVCCLYFKETYGEDPFLAGKLVQGYVRGLQGNHSRYVRANAGCKHFDVHGGPENIPVSRHSFDAKVSCLFSLLIVGLICIIDPRQRNHFKRHYWYRLEWKK